MILISAGSGDGIPKEGELISLVFGLAGEQTFRVGKEKDGLVDLHLSSEPGEYSSSPSVRVPREFLSGAKKVR